MGSYPVKLMLNFAHNSGRGLPIASPSVPEIGMYEIWATKSKTELIERPLTMRHQATVLDSEKEIEGARMHLLDLF